METIDVVLAVHDDLVDDLFDFDECSLSDNSTLNAEGFGVAIVCLAERCDDEKICSSSFSSVEDVFLNVVEDIVLLSKTSTSLSVYSPQNSIYSESSPSSIKYAAHGLSRFTVLPSKILNSGRTLLLTLSSLCDDDVRLI